MNPVFDSRSRCVICKENDWDVLQKVKRLNVSFILEICKNCGFVSQNPPLSEDYLKNYYLNNYVKNNYEGSLEEIYKESLLPAKARFNYLIENNLISNIDRTLEIGSGIGSMIKLFLEYGSEVCAIEPDYNAAAWLQNFDARIYNAFFNDIYKIKKSNWISNPFDCILLIHLLEHVKNPLEFMKDLHVILKNRGLLIIEVPNIKRPFSDDYSWGTFCDPGHLHYFSQNSLINVLCQSGFDIISITDKIFEPYGNIFCVAKKVNDHKSLQNLSDFDNVLEINNIWRGYVRNHKYKLLVYKFKQKYKKMLENTNLIKK